MVYSLGWLLFQGQIPPPGKCLYLRLCLCVTSLLFREVSESLATEMIIPSWMVESTVAPLTVVSLENFLPSALNTNAVQQTTTTECFPVFVQAVAT